MPPSCLNLLFGASSFLIHFFEMTMGAFGVDHAPEYENEGQRVSYELCARGATGSCGGPQQSGRSLVISEGRGLDVGEGAPEVGVEGAAYFDSNKTTDMSTITALC
ncbi:hypothetical protein ACJRO7_014423 [Eucalyptus globulus]|uniref:Uncharacterized protein n=1 Tax=Eucalyptus globulus TaxID=34317 RepID=A0ABD3LAQ1_EUCGL